MHMKVSGWALVTGAFALVAAFAATAGEEGKGPKTPLDLAQERLGPASPDHKKVYGGKNAPSGAFPFQVSLILAEAKKGEEFSYHFCGGSLISDTWVLTAGHCVTSEGEIVDPKGINVYVGSIDFKDGDRIAVKSVYRHPQYNADFTDNDVALLKLERTPRIDEGFFARNAGHGSYDRRLGNHRARFAFEELALHLGQDGGPDGVQHQYPEEPGDRPRRQPVGYRPQLPDLRR
jgi:hypothetical protein